ncbi:hypothetical protein [Streptomyces virginiae]|uniref:hypothetical protein n=1 Tax=Streptomyces virginiae TaxID=1961 RepID=UPI003428718A
MLGFLLMTAVSTAFIAALEADSGPSILKMISWVVGLLFLQISMSVRKRGMSGPYAIMAAVTAMNVVGMPGAADWQASSD